MWASRPSAEAAELSDDQVEAAADGIQDPIIGAFETGFKIGAKIAGALK